MGSTGKSTLAAHGSCEFQHLMSLLQAPEDIELPVLKSLYCLLDHFSSSSLQYSTYKLDLHETSTKDIETLSGILFNEMSKRFDHLFVDTSSNDRNLQQNMSKDAETFYLLLRCCLVTLTLPVAQHSILLERGKVILVLLRKLFSINIFEAGNRMGPHNSFLSATFEVFVDELLVHGQLKEHFRIIDFQASSEMIFTLQSCRGDTGIIMEILSRYFLTSWFDGHTPGDHLKRLLSLNHENLKISSKAQELHPTAALLLLSNPIILSSPKLIQAHFVSLVYEKTFMLQNLKTSLGPINFYLSLFEKSVALYMKYVSLLQVDCQSWFVGHSSTKGAEAKHIQPSFESCILGRTRKEVENLILKMEDSSPSHFYKLLIEMKSDLMNSCMTYVNESLYLVDKSCQDEVMSALSSLISRASDSFKENAIMDTSLQDICLLVSILKLTSSSLLQLVWCLRCVDSPKTLKDYSSCAEYNSILGTINCFRELRINDSSGQLVDIDFVNHKVSRMMFLHFLGLLSFSFSKRLDCLAKGCLFTIIALLNLFIFEEGNLDVLLHSLGDPTPDPGLSDVTTHEALPNKRSSLAVASKFQKARARCSRETVNGKIYLKCRQAPGEQGLDDFDELVDFVECKEGKDYTSWVKHRHKYHKLNFAKKKFLKQERKKKSWKAMKRRIS